MLCSVKPAPHGMPLQTHATHHRYFPGSVAGSDSNSTPAWCCSGDAPGDLDDKGEEAPEESSNEDRDHTEVDCDVAPSAGGRKGGPKERLQEPDNFSRVRDLARDEKEIRLDFPDWPGKGAATEVVVNEGAVFSSTLTAAASAPTPPCKALAEGLI